jgi:hypothetical protein
MRILASTSFGDDDGCVDMVLWFHLERESSCEPSVCSLLLTEAAIQINMLSGFILSPA